MVPDRPYFQRRKVKLDNIAALAAEPAGDAAIVPEPTSSPASLREPKAPPATGLRSEELATNDEGRSRLKGAGGERG
jgi:hypothetical protein